eukprot:6488993-Amphidinium_carterae.4
MTEGMRGDSKAGGHTNAALKARGEEGRGLDKVACEKGLTCEWLVEPKQSRNGASNVHLFPGDVNYWKQKLPLRAILSGKADGRTSDALRRAQQRSAEGGCLESGLLRNYLRLVEVANCLATSNLQGFSEEELQTMLQGMEVEKVELPLKVKSKLVLRHCKEHLRLKRYETLLTCMLPFEKKAWERQCPCLGHLETDDQDKIATFQDMFLRVVLKPWVEQGNNAKKEVVEFCNLSLKRIMEVDPLDLSNAYATALSNTKNICNCFLALGSESIDTSKQVLKGKIVNLLGEGHFCGCLMKSWTLSSVVVIDAKFKS